MRRILLVLALVGFLGLPSVSVGGQLLKPPKLEKMIKPAKFQHKKAAPGEFYTGKPAKAKCCF
ncbi:MAG: hypothetical protein NUV77_16385 [Thermoguttaceae bacterium]|jgi:hypothetical protein|nr:hypothetical protein [Thermoguttaceae bacterium]